MTTKTPVCESVVHFDPTRTVYTVWSKNVLKSECLFVVSYAIIYFSKNMDFTGRCARTITMMPNSLSPWMFLIFTFIVNAIKRFAVWKKDVVTKPHTHPDSTGEGSGGNRLVRT